MVRLYFDVAHYVLLTGVEEDGVRMFDPYYVDEPFPNENVVVTLEHPTTYNRIVPFDSFNRESHELYALGEREGREAVLLFNKRTQLTDEKTIEYFI